MNFSTLLVAIDGSDDDAQLLDFAAERVRGQPSRIILVHAIDYALAVPAYSVAMYDTTDLFDALDNASVEILNRAQQHLHDKGVISVETLKLDGSTASAISEYASKGKADAIIVGTHGRSGAAALLLGNIANGILRSAHIPIFTLRPNVVKAFGVLKKMLVAIDHDDVYDNVLRCAASLAKHEESEIALCHVAVASDTQRIEQFLSAQVDRLSSDGLVGSYVMLQGKASASIQEEAVRSEASIIVLGTHGRKGLQRMLLGSTAEQVIREAALPVLTVPLP